MIKTLCWSLLALLIAVIVFILNGIYFDIPRKVLEQKYAGHTSKFLRLSGGGKLHFTDEGHKDRQTIILLHGFTASHLNFKRVSPLLSNDLRVITIDLPGFGLTGAIPSRDYSINSVMNVIDELVENLEINKFSIGGNSMGGRVSWRYASAYPEKVFKLILIASGGVQQKQKERPFQTRKSDRPIAWRLMRSDTTRKFLTLFTPKFFAYQGLEKILYDPSLATRSFAEEFHDLVLMEGSREAILFDMTGDKNEPNGNLKLLQQIKAPTLIIHGQEDKIIDVESHLQFSKNIKDVRVKIYPRVGHLPMYEAPNLTARDIKAFLIEKSGSEKNFLEVGNSRKKARQQTQAKNAYGKWFSF